MKQLITLFGTTILLSFMTIPFSEDDLIGIWKIVKVKNSLNSEVDFTAFAGETFTYKPDNSVVHYNPNNPFEQEQTGKWEIRNDTLFQFNPGEEKVPFKILNLTKQELTVEQKIEEMVTIIYYRKIKKNTGANKK